MDVKHLLNKLNPDMSTHLNVLSKIQPETKSSLDKRWMKRDLAGRFNIQSDKWKQFTPGARTVATLSRIRHLGDTCTKCSRERTRVLASTKALRVELLLRFKEVSGESYGLTLGIYLKEIGPLWVEIVMMARELMCATFK